METKSNFIKHTSCEKCGSSDAKALYDNGSSYCFSCSSWCPGTSSISRIPNRVMGTMNSELTKGVLFRIKDRGLSEETCRKYGIQVIVADKKIVGHVYPYYEENHIGNKIRKLPKTFSVEGKVSSSQLFGKQLFPPGCSKSITVTEGELDAASVYQMQGGYPAISIPNGAQSAVACFKANLEYLESFANIYISFDNDVEGNKAALDAAKLLSPGKAKIVRLDSGLKDASGYLQANRQEDFVKTWWKAELYIPGGFIPSSNMKERLRNRTAVPSVPWPWEGLNDLTYGIRKKELVLISAPQKVGKTSICREISYHVLQAEPESRIGTLYLEESVEDSALGLVSINGSKPFHLPDTIYTDSEYSEAEKVLDDDRVIFYDHHGQRDLEGIVTRIRYLAKGLDCGYIILDNLSIITGDHSLGDERKLLDTITSRLVQLKDELGISLIVVAHLNREGQVFGSGAPEKFCNIHIRLERDKLHAVKDIRNTLDVIVMDNRYCGRTGPACSLRYNDETGRLEEVDKPTEFELEI